MRNLFLVLFLPFCLYASDIDYKEFKDGNEAIRWWENLYQNLQLTPEEKKIINEYTFGDFSSINKNLRDGKSLQSLSQEEQDKVKILDEALNKTIIFENLIVYRYESSGFLLRLFDEEFYKKVYSSGKFTSQAKHYLERIDHKRYKDYGFMSTTMIQNSVFQSRPIELVIKVPKYSSALFVSTKDLAVFQTQYELLFPRGSVLTIESYEISDDNKRLTLRVKMQDPCYINQPCQEEKVDNLRVPIQPLNPSQKQQSQ